MKKIDLFKFKKSGFVLLILLGWLVLLECTSRFIYYQRHGKYPVAIVHVMSILLTSIEKPLNKNGPRMELTDEQDRQIKKLRTIGYVAGSKKALRMRNVTIFDRKRSCQGLNLVVSGNAPEVLLMDMTGRVIHKWRCDVFRAFPQFNSGNASSFRRAHLMENGDIFAIFEGIGLIKLDRNSKIIWKKFNMAHHDLYVARNGLIYLLTRESHINERFDSSKPILEDFVSVLNEDGREVDKISILDAIENSPFAPILRRGAGDGDLLHTNTIELIEKQPTVSNHPLREGTILLSVLKLDFICAIDPLKRIAYWGESDYWNAQHQPTLLPGGNILVFDNKGFDGRSSVIEFNPILRKIEWFYRGDRKNPFYSETCGSCQRLDNGNTLITESDSGRAFEVTRDKKIVWEFINPNRVGNSNELIAALFEVIRLKRDFPTDWLSK